MDAHEKDIYSTVTSPSLTYEQKLKTLANQAEDELNFFGNTRENASLFPDGSHQRSFRRACALSSKIYQARL